MFAYCTDILHLSEHEAYLRITVARAAREHPILLTMLAEGRLHLSGIAKLVPHLTGSNREGLLARAVHKSKREIEELVAAIAPQPEAPARIRKLPEPRDVRAAQVATAGTLLGASAEAGATAGLGPDRVAPSETRTPERPALVQPLAPTRYKIQFTAGAAFRDKLERLKALMRSSVPDGDLAQILEQAVTEKLERLEARRFGRTKAPRKGLAETDTVAGSSRYIPAAVRRAVHERDLGRCRYVDGKGRRCRTRNRLEFHHVHAWARGGDRSVENIRLMCQAHNALLAERDFGANVMSRYRRAPTVSSSGPDSPAHPCP